MSTDPCDSDRYPGLCGLQRSGVSLSCLLKRQLRCDVARHSNNWLERFVAGNVFLDRASLRLIVRRQGIHRAGILMKAYVITTGTVFALLFAAHVWRAVAEGWALAKNPIFLLTTAAAAALVVWAWRVVRKMPRS